MNDTASRRRAALAPSGTELIFIWFQRVVAGYCLFFGILYWVRLIGFYEAPLWRFDLMPVHWQIATILLSVFFPFAAAGLWMLASWGPVIWFICAVTETVDVCRLSRTVRATSWLIARLARRRGAALRCASASSLHWQNRQRPSSFGLFGSQNI